MLGRFRFMCAQPAIDYYTWQVEVLINNFIETGVDPSSIDIVCMTINGIIPDNWSKLVNHYNLVNFYFYNDTRKTKSYTSSIRPNILKQHWLAHPELVYDTIFYHDNDIAFTKPINWEQFMHDDKWYGSDTRWYIGHDYIVSKGEDVLNKMCEIIGIDKDVVKRNELNNIGAQYLIKNVDCRFWDNVEKDSERLFKEISEMNAEKMAIDPTYHTLQIWCADMWAILWNGWKLKRETVCHDDLRFSWATGDVDDWNKYNIFHNAGVVNDKDGLFYKANYMSELPYGEKLAIKEGTASYMYWNLVQETAKKTVLI